MRTKRSAGRRFHRSFHASDSATIARPLPPPITDNVSNENDSGEDKMEVQKSTGSDDSESDFSGVEMTNAFDEKTCLECGRSERLLFCCGIGCPVALHEKCLLSQPRYDEGRKFYCPYCWCKLQEARTEELRKKVMLAKQDMNSFINFRRQMICCDKEKLNNKRVKKKDLNVRTNLAETNQCQHVSSMEVDEVHKVALDVEEDHQHNDNNVNLPCIVQSGVVTECEKLSVNQTHGVLEDEVGLGQGMNEHQDYDEIHADKEEEIFKNGVHQLGGDHRRNSKLKHPCSDRSREVAEREKMSAAHAHRIVEDEVGMEQGKYDQLDDDEKDEEINADEEQVETLTAQCVAENIAVDGAFHGSLGGKSETANKSEGDRATVEREEQMDKDTNTANVSCATKDSALPDPEMPDSETVRLLKQRNSQKEASLKKSKANSHTTSTKAARKPVEEVAPLKKPVLPEMPAKKIYSPVAHESRKRILWKPEEDETLREGVHKFSATVSKNLHWKKILEFGRHVFDPSQNPVDLKDKWRKIFGKES